jgi:hypothetical protein
MIYADLCTAIEDTCENTFTASQLALFTQQAEQAIYNSVQLPSLRKTANTPLTIGDMYLNAPTDFISPFSLAVIDATGAYSFVLNKDVNFIREAYPTPTVTGLPRFYAVYGPQSAAPSELRFIVGPTPDVAYVTELQYYFYPESLVTAGSTWLGDTFDSALLNRALLEASRFMKAEADIVTLYQGMADKSLALLKNLGDGKLRQDAYRSGQTRMPVQ